MIVSYSMYEGLGAGFRELIFLRRWKLLKTKLDEIDFEGPALRARIMIHDCPGYTTIIGVEGESFIVEYGVPIAGFQDLLIEQRNDVVMDLLYRTILIAHEHYQLPVPPEVAGIFGLTG